MTEYEMNHLIQWAQTHRFHAFEVYTSIMQYLAKLDQDTVRYLLNNRSWSEIEELTYR